MPGTMDTHGENRPLLGSSEVQPTPTSKSQKLTVMIATITLILAIDFGFFLTVAPQTKVFESIVCQNYIAGLPKNMGKTLAEDICKSELVQSELALVNGWKDTSDVLPVLWFNLTEAYVAGFYSTVLPLRLVWLSVVWRFIGGGDITLSSTALVIIADQFPQEEMATALFRIVSATLLSEVLATPVSAYSMTRDAWTPYMLGLGIATLGSISAFLMPETLTNAKSKISSVGVNIEEEQEAEIQSQLATKGSIRHYIGRKVYEVRELTQSVIGSPAVTVCLFAQFITSISKQSTSILLQYTSKRFDWSIGNSSLLVSLRGIITLVNFLVIMLAISSLLIRYSHLSGNLKDLRLARISSFVSALGFIIMATANSRVVLILGIVLLALGAVFAVSCRTFVTSLVRLDRVGTLESSAAALTSFGTVVSGPLLAYSFRLGLSLGPALFGLPFILAGAIYLLGSVLLIPVKVPDTIYG
ncbi:MFS general substrate transporter [Penicillium angulare]|uniref:MFS general substrate transporter n=1 Tax=Penicillium angulare TaxID=116970 RepID=UPI002541C468|nr:MFS general substrate transporter [Penicillium angulare]KAJ5280424.1 MFS general substrate transporter [Penicillium angulare]